MLRTGQYLSRYKKIKFYAQSIGLGQEADDFFQEDCLRRLEGKDLRKKAKYAVIDSLRRQGRGTRDGRVIPEILQEIETPAPLSKTHELDEALRFLNSRDRGILILHYIYGYSTREIGYIFGIVQGHARLVIIEAASKARATERRRETRESHPSPRVDPRSHRP